MNGPLELPPHFAPEKVGEVWQVDYQKIAAAALDWKDKQRLSPACHDQPRICLFGVDVQNTFCIPGFELFVGGPSGQAAVEDTRRLCRFIYRNLRWITQFVITMDSHQPFQIFHPAFLENSEGLNPDPFSVITQKEVDAGLWRVNSEFCKSHGVAPDWAQEHIRAYSEKLKESGKYEWTVWPYHAMLGGIGHALVAAFEEAVFFHSIARSSMPKIHLKGRNPWTEHYSVLGPEVPVPEEVDNGLQEPNGLFDQLLKFDKVLIAGQAKSHCVAWTVADLLKGISDQGQDAAGRFCLLEDCTSPVVVPGISDFTEEADAKFEEFRQAGIHIIRSTDPVSEWFESGN